MIMTSNMTILSTLAGIGILMSGCSNELELPTYTGPKNPVEISPEDSDLLHFEGRAEPLSCGRNLVKRFIEVPNSNWGRTDRASSSFVTYPDVCEWLGAFWFLEAAIDNADRKGDSEAKQEAIGLMQGIVDRYDDVITGKTTFGSGTPLYTGLLWRYDTGENRVDYYIWGAISLHIASIMDNPKYSGVSWPQTREEYLEFGLQYAESQFHPYTFEEFKARFKDPASYDMGRVDPGKKYDLPQEKYNSWKGYLDKGYSWQTRLWIDDMFMITSLQMQAYQATKNDASYNTEVTYPGYNKLNNQNRFLDRAVREMKLYIEEIQGSGGLYWHSPSAQQFWARGNGWMAVGMPLMLQLIEDIPDYAAEAALLKDEYKRMMAALLNYQQPGGCWAQLIDYPTMWTETSGSAMFTYAFITGVKNGWLDADIYGSAARKAWNTLSGTYLDENYDLRDVCAGTGTGSTVGHYESRERTTGDTHGQAAMLWCTTALTELANNALADKTEK